jgi:hypothetical protein
MALKKEKLKLSDFIVLIFARSFQWIIIVLVWALWIALLSSLLLIPYAIVLLPIVALIFMFYVKINHLIFMNYIQGNVIVHGGRGKGKGLLFDYALDNIGPAIVNVPYGKHEVIDPKTYFGSIAPNTALSFLQGKITKVNKHHDWEGKPYALDDGALFFPNYNDNEIKRLYPNITLMLPIQRHLYGTYTIINAQNIERLFKPLRELQDDGYIKALKTWGKGYIWNRLPVLRHYFVTFWRYHEQLDCAINNTLPFGKLGLINSATGPLMTSTPEAIKKQYEATNGVIKDGFIVRKKKHIKYDTRYFRTVFFTDDDNPLTPDKQNPLDKNESPIS